MKWDLKRYILIISLQCKVFIRGSTWYFDPLFWNVHQNKIFLFAKFLKKSPKKLWISLLKVTDSSKLAMTEYWKSQAKKFCDFCKCWIADNKAVSHSFPHHFSQVFKTISRNFSEHFISRKWSKTSASRGKSTLRNQTKRQKGWFEGQTRGRLVKRYWTQGHERLPIERFGK